MSATLLLVDDEEKLRLYVARFLRMQGYEVIEACDGLDALEKMAVTQPDLVICDLRMPAMDGLEFLHALRSRSEKNCPFLFLTASAESARRELALAQGADEYLAKPVSLHVLQHTIEGLLRA